MTRKTLYLFIAAVDLVYLQSDMLLNNSGDRQNNQSTHSGLVLTIIAHLASLQSLQKKLTSLQNLSSCQTRSLGTSNAMAKPFPPLEEKSKDLQLKDATEPQWLSALEPSHELVSAVQLPGLWVSPHLQGKHEGKRKTVKFYFQDGPFTCGC